MGVDFQVSLRLQDQVEPSMPEGRVQHMVEEGYAGVHPVFQGGAVQIQGKSDLGFPGIPLEFSES